MQSTVAIVPLLILLVLVIGLVLGLIIWLTSRPSRDDAHEMACGGCGYPVRGNESLHCPECGADLRKVGIQKPKSGPSRTIGIALTVLCGGILALSCVMAGLFWVQSANTKIQHPVIHTQPSTTHTSPQPTPSTSSSVTTPTPEPAESE